MAAAVIHEITELTELTRSFPAACESPGRARRLVGCELRRWGHEEGLVDDAVLVVSELASNAVIHAGSPFTVSIQSRDSLLRIAVRDTAPVPAPNGDRGLLVRAPHGLAVVQALADQWGVEPTGDGIGIGKIVWAELRIF
jgi:anti-sigma regulatory factor (Ser/Thr protein kinase)